jgi:hypothetical protein
MKLLEFLAMEDLIGGASTTAIDTPNNQQDPSQEQNWEDEATSLGFVDPIELIDTIQSDGAKIEATIEGDLPPEEGTEEGPLEDDDEEDGVLHNRVDTAVEMTETPAMPTETPSNGTFTDDRNLALQVVANSKGTFKLDRRNKGAYRLQLVNDKDKERAAQLIISALKGFKAKTIAPGDPGASSSKYTTYVLAKSAKETVKIVFGAGKNEGQKFEVRLKNSIASRKGHYWDALVLNLKTHFGIRPSNIKRVVKKVGGASNVKRPFAATIPDVGASLSDMDLVLFRKVKLGDTLTDVVHVSIKDRRGDTFANTGYTDGFTTKVSPAGVTTVTPVPSKNAAADAFLLALGIDKNLVAKGINDVLRHQEGKKVKSTHAYNVIPTVNKTLVAKLLAAQMGYGYLYAREAKSGPGLKVIDLYKPEKVQAQIGTITGITAAYPFVDGTKKSKQLSVFIQTTMGRFVVEVRNTKGGVLPGELKIKFYDNGYR